MVTVATSLARSISYGLMALTLSLIAERPLAAEQDDPTPGEASARAAIARVIQADRALASVLAQLPAEPSIDAQRGDSLIQIAGGLEALLRWCDTAVDVHREIVRRMRAIPFGDTPREFRFAYLDHVDAWTKKTEAVIRTRTQLRQLVTLAERSARDGAEPVADDVLARIVDGLRETNAADRASTAAIADTWLDVRAVSLAYGVDAEDPAGSPSPSSRE